MINLPDFTKYGYQTIAELGRNRQGGRITWKGRDLTEEKIVVIKQFCFATVGSSWSGYKIYQQEITVLQKLEHPSIPKYLNAFETESGFCLIQEYKEASKLSDFRQLTLAETKKVLVEILKILVYLQQQNPPILHLDIKPENILIDDLLNIYLIDFGFASLGSEEVAISSIFKGTPGFIAPEQIIKPTTASDLYGLGVTAICLLLQKNSSQIGELIDDSTPYELKFKPELPPLNRAFISWLEKMVQPQASKRYPDARTAKNALEIADIEPKEIVLAEELQSLTNLTPERVQLILGTGSIAFLSAIAVWGLHFAHWRSDNSGFNIAIAIIIAFIVAIAEIGSLTIAIAERRDTVSSLALSVTVPALLVTSGSFFFGNHLAVTSSSAIIVSQIFCSLYFFRQKLPSQTGFLLAAIVFGITLGLKLIS